MFMTSPTTPKQTASDEPTFKPHRILVEFLVGPEYSQEDGGKPLARSQAEAVLWKALNATFEATSDVMRHNGQNELKGMRFVQEE